MLLKKQARRCDSMSIVVLWMLISFAVLVILASLKLSKQNLHCSPQTAEDCLTPTRTEVSISTGAPRLWANQSSPTPVSTVVVAHPGIFWWVRDFGPHWQVPGCRFQGRPLQCRYVSTAHANGNTTAHALLQRANALVHEGCWDPTIVDGAYRHIPQVMFSMEPVTNWPCIDQQIADIEMSYRTCAQVWTPYWPWKDTLFSPTALYRDPALRQHPLEFSQKLNAIIYINTQCAAKSGRQDVVRQLVTLLKESNSTLSVHSFGKCDPNMPKAELDKFHEDDTDITRLHKKVDYFRRYKFCITMENSMTKDYVTEKVYDGLVAGCVPIYLGAPNIDKYIPDSNAIVDYARFGTPAALKEELERLARDQAAYEQKLLWKVKAQRRWNPGFQDLLAYSEQHPMCSLCSYLAAASQQGGLQNNTLCSANKTWHNIL